MPSITELLVPLDGSDRSCAAVEVAVALGDRLEVPITAVRVCPPWSDCAPDLEWLDSHLPGTVRGVVVVAEHAAPALLAFAAERPGSVLCMSSHGRSGLPAVVLGSVSTEVVRTSPDPVLVVGPHARRPTDFGRIEVCVHGPPGRVAGPAATWAKALGAIPTVVTVQGVDDLRWDDTPAAEELLAVDEHLRADGLAPELLVLHGDAAPELARRARDDRAALLVAATECRRGMSDLLVGSVARRLVREAQQPVLLVGPSVGPD